MTKRSAMTMAAGLATCLVLGVVAIMLMAGGVSIANAGAENKPLVRREVQTITVHRKAHSSDAGVVRVIHLSSSSSMSSSHENEMENENEGFEHEGNDDGSSQHQGDNQQDGGPQGPSGDD